MKRKLLFCALLGFGALNAATHIKDVAFQYHKKDDYYTMNIRFEANVAAPLQIFLDIDNNDATGYSSGQIVGADRLIQINTLRDTEHPVYAYDGSDGSNEWSWQESYSLSNDDIWIERTALHITLDRYYLGLRHSSKNDRFGYRIRVLDKDEKTSLTSYPQYRNMETYVFGDGQIDFTSKQQTIADTIVNIFEYSTTDIQYGQAQVVPGDEVHGITAGRVGFTTATGDMLDFFLHYYHHEPFLRYIPELQRLYRLYAENGYETSDDPNGSMNVEHLTGLIEDWNDESLKKAFRQAQDRYAYDHYFIPARQEARRIHLNLPISLLSFYDTAIQHGVEGLHTLIKKVKLSKPKNKKQEIRWLKKFFKKRLKVLRRHPEWKDTLYRVHTLNDLLKAKRYNLNIKTLTVKDWDNETFHLISDAPKENGRFDSSVDEAVLQIQGIDDGHAHDVDEDDCYEATDATRTFSVWENRLKRCELRLFKHQEWPLSDERSIFGTVRLSGIQEGTKEFTWMQLHHTGGNHKPLVRFAWIQDGKQHKDAISGKKYTEGLWAIVRQDDKTVGSAGSKYYYFGSVSHVKGRYFPVSMRISDGGDTLILRIDETTRTIKTPLSWVKRTDADGNEASDYYFKAGLYFSGSLNTMREADVSYQALYTR